MRTGIDANILLRALLDDDAVQSPISRAFLSELDDVNEGYVGISVLMELFWILKSRYKIPRHELSGTLRALLMTEAMEFESFDAVVRALALFDEGRADFPDALLAERNREAGCGSTVTLDEKAAARLPGVKLLAGTQ